jgi:hypothetical protein
LVPVALCVGDTCNSLVLSRALNRPASLGDPHRLSHSVGNGLVKSVVKCLVGSGDAVGIRVLEIGIGISANKVNSLDDSCVASIIPGIPSVYMCDLRSHSTGSEVATDLVDVVDKLLRLCPDTSVVHDTDGTPSVEIFGAN